MQKEFQSFFLELVETFVSSLVVILVLYMWVALPEQVWGASMEPNFHTGERVLVEKITMHFNKFERGDVVVLHPPANDSIDYIKRIVALPGEMIKIIDCKVYISQNDTTFQLSEPYLPSGTCTSVGPAIREGRFLKLGDNEYFALGDNRGNSADSRYFGPINSDRILGKAILRFWPPNKIGFL
ncbi:MAG: signal peptidase I [Candidatus Saccharibacteria bacterium]|nr:signal peptidase I [Candidatus Saccharibacteria bacterium]